MATSSSTIPTAVAAPQPPVKAAHSVVAVYRHHPDAEEAVYRLQRVGIPVQKVSIVGRDFQRREDAQGYYRPGDSTHGIAGSEAWRGGLFGLLMGFGLFVLPVAGTLIVLGPLAGQMATAAAGGAGVGVLLSGLMALGVPRERALKYQARLQAGEFLVLVTGSSEEVARARETLQDSGYIELQTHWGSDAM